MIKFVSSNSFAAKSVEQMRVEQSQFEQFTPTHTFKINYKQGNQSTRLLSNMLSQSHYLYILKNTPIGLIWDYLLDI